MPLPAKAIQVHGFRTTLFWPLILDSPCESAERPKIVAQQLSKLTEHRGWKRVEDLLDHIPPPPGGSTAHLAHSYGELTYFHEFVQHFLFARPDADRRPGPMQLFRRTDITELDVLFSTTGETLYFPMRVDRINLYVIAELGVAFLAIEASLSAVGDNPAKVCFGEKSESDRAAAGDFESLVERPLTLADVLRFNDGFRRAHAPYLTDDLSPPVGNGIVPRAVRWRGAGQPFDLLPGGRASESAVAARRLRCGVGPRAIPPFRHFAHLLEGWAFSPRGTQGDSWRHLADDRLPVLSCIQLPNAFAYRGISEGDWARLCFVDPPGTDPVPYASEFLRQDWARHAYDRFHYASGYSSDPSARYLISGYSMTAVGSGWFFGNFITQHVRRHYFQLMLLAQIERAALLAISGEISRAVRRHETETGGAIEKLEKLEERLQSAERDFLQFIHRFRFTGVSDQIQPTEMFAMLRRNMRLPELFDDLKEELTTATDFLGLLNQQRQTANATRLSVVATFGVIFGLAFALLGVNVMSAESVKGFLDLLPSRKDQGSGVAALGVVTFTVGLCFLLGWVLARIAMPRKRPGAEDPLGVRLRRLLGWFGCAGLLVGVGLLIAATCLPL